MGTGVGGELGYALNSRAESRYCELNILVRRRPERILRWIQAAVFRRHNNVELGLFSDSDHGRSRLYFDAGGHAVARRLGFDR